jgi:CIC family chloride channel protein
LNRPRAVLGSDTIAAFRRDFPLGSSVNTIVVVDNAYRYRGLVYVPAAHDARHDPVASETAIETIAVQQGCSIDRHASILQAMRLFGNHGWESMAVTEPGSGRVVGLLREGSVIRRYAAEVERAVAN